MCRRKHMVSLPIFWPENQLSRLTRDVRISGACRIEPNSPNPSNLTPHPTQVSSVPGPLRPAGLLSSLIGGCHTIQKQHPIVAQIDRPILVVKALVRPRILDFSPIRVWLSESSVIKLPKLGKCDGRQP